jgi:hypothetical protein
MWSKGCVPLVAWLVRQGNKGYFPEGPYMALVKQVQELISPGAQAALLGDGELDGPDLQHIVQAVGWS